MPTIRALKVGTLVLALSLALSACSPSPNSDAPARSVEPPIGASAPVSPTSEAAICEMVDALAAAGPAAILTSLSQGVPDQQLARLATQVEAARTGLAGVNWPEGTALVEALDAAALGLLQLLEEPLDSKADPSGRFVLAVTVFWTKVESADIHLAELASDISCGAVLPARPDRSRVGTPPPSVSPEEITELSLCLREAERAGHTVDRALEDCEPKRPAGFLRQVACGVFVTFRYHDRQGHSVAETGDEIIRQCSVY